MQLSNFDIRVRRAEGLDCGWIIEYDSNNLTPEEVNLRVNRLGDIIWNEKKDVIYSFYSYRNEEELFKVEGILRLTETTKTFNTSYSVLGASDVYINVPRYDVDKLTHTGSSSTGSIIFQVDRTSHQQDPTLIQYKELDIEGFQFPIHSKAKITDDPKFPNCYKVSVTPGLNL